MLLDKESRIVIPPARNVFVYTEFSLTTLVSCWMTLRLFYLQHKQTLQTLCLLIDPWNDDVLAVKKKLLEKSETTSYFQPKDLFMVCNGKPLSEDNVNDNSNYRQNGVVVVGDGGLCRRHHFFREGTTVLVSYRNRGGCFMVSFSILLMIGAALIGSFCTCGLSLCVVPFLVPLLFILPLFCL